MACYLLFDSHHVDMPALAAEIDSATKGALSVADLHDPRFQPVLDQAADTWNAGATLLENNNDSVRLATGAKLQLRLVSLLGPRRAWHVAQLVAEAQVPLASLNSSRRGFVRQGGAVVAGVIGAVLLGREPNFVDGPNGSVSAAKMIGQGQNNPGKYSRKAGLRSWDVRRRGSVFTVAFRHTDRKRSGKVKVTYGRGGKTATWTLD